ncbi:hypothetical protein P9181_02750 [Bacillus velezensis]|uniref:hypothetical protein n=1 Tax=Bacillus velezensis TaxID=492670 RepID=UPI002DBF0AE5|nr:hypothetical protein [Bacillus velezensis]MEC3610285.1 hypothetical protein [Bacillus velezensis]MEC3679982.1 hypothetical protein [Bacillus velezensis]
MSAAGNRQKFWVMAMFIAVFAVFVFSFSENHSQKDWHTAVDQASVNVFGQQIFEKNRLAKTLDAREAESLLTLVKLANEEHHII